MLLFHRIFKSWNIVDNLWHHVEFLWYQNSGYWSLYLDGLLSKDGLDWKKQAMLPGNSTLVLGQTAITAATSEFMDGASFCGDISQFYLSNTVGLRDLFEVGLNKKMLPVVTWSAFKLWASNGVQEIVPSSSTYLGNYAFTFSVYQHLASSFIEVIHNVTFGNKKEKFDQFC